MGWEIAGAILIGLTLGLLGSGGSAITVPVLIYLVGHGGKVSIAESMAIVGLISIAAAIPYGRKRLIDWRSVLWFGVPGVMGTYLGAWLGGLAPEVLQLTVFGIVLVLAAGAMMTRPKVKSELTKMDDPAAKRSEYIEFGYARGLKIAVEGMLVGGLTGFVGVGGGFLIVPALVLFGNLPIRLAIGTSLVIIAAKSVVGFAKYQTYLMEHELSVDLSTIAIFASLGVLGSIAGRAINRRLNQDVLRVSFATFLILLGSFVIVREGSRFLPKSPTSHAPSSIVPTVSASHVRASDIPLIPSVGKRS